MPSLTDNYGNPVDTSQGKATLLKDFFLITSGYHWGRKTVPEALLWKYTNFHQSYFQVCSEDSVAEFLANIDASTSTCTGIDGISARMNCYSSLTKLISLSPSTGALPIPHVE